MEMITIRERNGTLIAAVPSVPGAIGPGSVVAAIMAATTDKGVRYLTTVDIDVPPGAEVVDDEDW